MSVLDSMKPIADFVDDVSPQIKAEMESRYEELTRLEQEQTQMGTSTPMLYASLQRFVANPSTVSVETYKRMLDTDETVGAGIDFMNLAFIARFGDYQHPNKDIEKFVRRALNEMEGSWHENLDEMFSAEWSGFSVTEQVWKFDPDFDGAPAFVPKKVVTYPPLTMVFAVDRHGKILQDGVYQYQRFHNTYLNNASMLNPLDGFRPDTLAKSGDYPYPIRISSDLTYLTVKLPLDKIIHLRSSSTGKFDNPYGRSILRRAYKNWVMKEAFLKMWLVAADKKGTPLVVGYAAPNDSVLSDNQRPGQYGSDPQPMRADQAMASAFKNMHNSSFMVLPGRKGEQFDIEAIAVQGDLNVFKEGVDYFNAAIMRALLIPPLIMTGGDGKGSYALSETHSKMFNKIIDGKLKVYKQGILEQFIKKIIAYNFPNDLWAKDGAGDFVFEEHDPEMMEKLANVFGSLTEKGYMDAGSQADFDEVRSKMGVNKRKVSNESFGDSNDISDPSASDIEKLPGEYAP